MRRGHYSSLTYHVTIIWEAHSDLPDVLAIEILVKSDPVEDEYSPGFDNEGIFCTFFEFMLLMYIIK